MYTCYPFLRFLMNSTFHFQRGLKNICVLEARERVGGRTCTELLDLGEGRTVWCDVGGAYIGPTQDRILRLARELGVQTYPVYAAGKSVMKVTGKPFKTYSGAIPSLPLFALLDLNGLLVETYKLSERINKQTPWLAPDADLLDSITVKEWLDKQAWTKDARSLYESGVSSLFCADPQEISMLYFLWFVHMAGGFKRLIETENGAQERKFVNGSQRISNALAEQLGHRVHLGKVVKHIDWSKDELVTIVVAENRDPTNISIYKAKRAIIALAPTLYSSLGFSPSLPVLKAQLGQRMPMGSIIKSIAYYAKPFWRDNGFSGVIVNEDGPVLYSFDDCKPSGDVYALMGFINAKHHRIWATKSLEERKTAVLAEYSHAFGSEEALHPICYIEKDWTLEPFSGGCYLGVMPPNVMTQFGKVLREPVGAVHFAGTETATKWMGYMDGAVQAGERAAHEVLEFFGANSTMGLSKLPSFIEDEPPAHDISCLYSGPTTLEKALPGPATAIKAFLLLGVAAGCISAHLVLKHYAWRTPQKGRL
eukprot:TRINITY_DN4678_c0_g1_i3.p1 TRINITY_DN4678_c0_g1~~TRINITY_DN4678_c0_g1_i3.p1  ORF type:complete len:536 (+),score=30.81 TRINITY_DN4678_c0_g1_i3:91-1698(+)